MKRGLSFALLALYLAAGWTVRGATSYVDQAGAGGDGQTWATAFTNLQNALNGAVSGSVVWVAQGVYYPTNGTDRTATFALVNGITIYGGFVNGMSSLSQRNWTTYETVLSGNIGDVATNADNSYHVVTCTNNATLDGFIITGGYADGTLSPTNRGGGLYITSPADGASAVSNYPRFENCTFTGNKARTYGGAAAFASYNTSYLKCLPQFVNCSFWSNSVFTNRSPACYGGALAGFSASPTIQGCTFGGNSAHAAGAVYMSGTLSHPVFTNCTFGGNYTLYDSSHSGSGGALYNAGGGAVIDNCLFANNYAGWDNPIFGGAIYSAASSPSTIRNCRFVGNWGYYCGAIYLGASDIGTEVRNCLFAGNFAIDKGSSIYNCGARPSVVNCTFGGNYAENHMYNCSAASAAVTNCIFWNTEIGKQILNDASTSTVSYTYIHGGLGDGGVSNLNGGAVVDGGNNSSNNPLFPAVESGTWTADGVYDRSRGQCTLTNASASWPVNSLAGKSVRANTAWSWYCMEYYIISNSAKTILVWGNASSSRTGSSLSGKTYEIRDYHLKSRMGRWVVASQSWTNDAVDSPCIDAGNPASDYSLEPRPNGHRVNMGSDGGTPEASMTFVPRGAVFFVR